LTVIDIMPFAAFCMSCARWREAEEALARIAANDALTKGLVIRSPDGSQRTNPLVKISADAAASMVRYASEFGMTAAARSRITGGISPPPGPSKFDGLLGGPNA
jgi:P27 family predicted phage terminase small subunit